MAAVRETRCLDSAVMFVAKEKTNIKGQLTTIRPVVFVEKSTIKGSGSGADNVQ